jgi:hypothetical protein
MRPSQTVTRDEDADKQKQELEHSGRVATGHGERALS